MWDETVVAVVAEGVGGYVADGCFGEVGWKRGAGREEEFVGAGGVFDAGPDVVAGVELEEGFEEVAVSMLRRVSDFVRPQRRVVDQLPVAGVVMFMPGMLVVSWWMPMGRLYMMDAVWRCWFSLG